LADKIDHSFRDSKSSRKQGSYAAGTRYCHDAQKQQLTNDACASPEDHPIISNTTSGVLYNLI